MVYMTKPDYTYTSMTVRELLPMGFEPNTLIYEERLDQDKEVKGGPNGLPHTASGIILSPRTTEDGQLMEESNNMDALSCEQ